MSVGSAEVADALARAATLGEFFAVEPLADAAGWLPLTALVTDGGALGEQVERMRRRLGAPSLDRRVAASTLSLGILARLLAPAFGAVCVAGVLPVFTVESSWWQPLPGASLRFAVVPVEGRRVGSAANSEYADIVVAGLALPVVAAFAGEGVSPVVLIGNVASALGGAATMVSNARPELASEAWTLVGELLAGTVLEGTATIGAGGRSLRRNSCCLFYRVPGGGYCGDCVLGDRGAFRR